MKKKNKQENEEQEEKPGTQVEYHSMFFRWGIGVWTSGRVWERGTRWTLTLGDSDSSVIVRKGVVATASMSEKGGGVFGVNNSVSNSIDNVVSESAISTIGIERCCQQLSTIINGTQRSRKESTGVVIVLYVGIRRSSLQKLAIGPRRK